MATAATRSQLGPGLNHVPNPGSRPESSPWRPLENRPNKESRPHQTIELGSRCATGPHLPVCQSIFNLKLVRRPCLKSRRLEQTLSLGKTKRLHVLLRQRLGLQHQQILKPHGWGEQFHINTGFIKQKFGFKSYEDLKDELRERLLRTEHKTSRLIVSPHCCQKLQRKVLQPGDGSKQELKLNLASPENNPKFVINPGLHFSPMFEQRLDQRTVQEPSRTLRPHNLLSSYFSFLHLQPLLPFIFLFFLASFVNLTYAGPPRPARPPLLSGQPFIVFWGIKDKSCSNRPDFRSFGIEPDGRVAVFYEDTLGNYPYFVDRENSINGGLPQHTKLDLHIQKTQADVETALPAPRYLGLGVVRWQEWFPQWSRIGSRQGLYQNATRRLLRRFFPDWTRQELERWSKVDFEAAAQSVMTETLREVQRSRPKALWGMCPYPSCANGSPAQTAQSNYTGECPEEQRNLNDQLLWLWRRSNAIYPLLTLEKIQGGTRGATLFLSNQIREALRVASLGGSSDDLPVFPLVRSVYASTNTFLSLSDLVTTIGESAALGTAGIVIWDKTEAKTERECEELGRFTSSVLGPYVSNVTAASRLCSASLCQNRGRCVRLDQDKPTYLHLPPNSQDTEDTQDTQDKEDKSDEATDQPDPSPKPDPDPAELWKRDFQCQWFSSADRDVSDQQSPKDGAPSVGKREDSVGRGLDVLITVSDGLSTTTGAYRAQNAENGGSVSPKTTLEMAVDGGAVKSTSKSMLLLLLLVLYLWT